MGASAATTPGIDKRTAEGLIAEIGVDMSVFGDAAQLASWAGRCPGQYESAGKSRSDKTRKGNKWLRNYLHDAATSAVRAKNTYSAAQYVRVKGRRGHAKALGAVQHSILVSIVHMLDRDEPYRELGADHFTLRHTPERRVRGVADDELRWARWRVPATTINPAGRATDTAREMTSSVASRPLAPCRCPRWKARCGTENAR